MNARPSTRISIVATVIMLMAACHDDPVALNEPEPPALLDEPPREVAVSSGGSSAAAAVDHTRPRFKLDIAASGALTPNASIAVTLQGRAVEKVAGGTVTVTLPTMAGMEYAGAGKRPYYPVGRSFPVERQWTLSSMEPGDTWQRSFTIKLPEMGYYDLSIFADTEAPAGERGNPYVSDDVQYERWMLVTDTGGRLTLEFDEEVFADGIAPVPGPFHDKIGRSGTASQAATDYGDGVGMDSHDYVYMNAVYVRNGVNIAAVGAYAHAAEWHNHDHTDGPWNQQAATVGPSGIVRFECPRPGFHLKGAVDLPSTAHMAGSGFSGYWQARSSDCGDTIMAAGSDRRYLPWKNLRDVIPKILRHFGNPSVPRVAWFTSSTDSLSAYFDREHRIRFGTTSYHNDWTAAHEYGHALHEKAYGGLWDAEESCYESHDIWEISGYLCAFQEGFADYAAGIGAWGFAWESAPPGSPAPDPRMEGYIAMLFQDLIDPLNENNDETNYSASSVATAFRSCRVRVGGNWRKRNNVSDFVWCLENRINGSVHDDHFPGLAAPTHQSAARGSGWDAADIRSTWLQNLTG